MKIYISVKKEKREDGYSLIPYDVDLNSDAFTIDETIRVVAVEVDPEKIWSLFSEQSIPVVNA